MKRMTWLTAALTVAVLAFMGCSNPTSDDDSSSGVLGQVAGVVYDAVTGLPVDKASVTIAGRTVTTNKNGSYFIKDVIPGAYTLTVTKGDGYSAYSLDNIIVDAEQYKKDDPFLEYHNLVTQIAEFENWITALHAEGKYPDYPASAALPGGSTWTYQDGIYVNDDGSASVTVTQGEGDTAFPKFDVAYNKLDYTYEYGLTTNIVKLVPLTGGFVGKIDVVFEVYEQTLEVTETAPIKEGVEIYFVDTVDISQTGVDVNRKYGPFKTGADGSFTATKLPANTAFIIEINPFAQAKGTDGPEYYFDVTTAYKTSDWSSGEEIDLTSDTFTTSVGNKEIAGKTKTDPVTIEGYTDLGKFIIFTVGNVAYVTESNVPNAHAPFAISGSTPGKIELTFNKPILVGSFKATLDIESNAAHTTTTEQLLLPEWSEDKLSVTLTAGDKLNDYTNISFPYSTSAGDPAATLVIDGHAEDGSAIYTEFGIDIYTEEIVKPVSIEYLAPAAAPARAAFAQTGGAIKITFSKDLDPDYLGTKFEIDSQEVYYKFDSTDAKVVYVYTDVEASAADVDYTVAASADDYKTDTLVGDLEVGIPQNLLVSTNLYTGRDLVPQDPSDTTAIFPVGASITFTFAGSFPSGAKPVVVLRRSGVTDPIAASAEIPADALNKVIVTPALLVRDVIHTLSLKVLDSNDRTIYSNPITAGQQGSVFIVSNLISFKPAGVKKLNLIRTNLYTNRDTGVEPTSIEIAANTLNNFPVNTPIELFFDADIPVYNATTNPEGAKLEAVLEDSAGYAVPITSAIDGAKVTVTPASALKPGAAYNLLVALNGVSNGDYYAIVANPLIYIATNRISFKTQLSTKPVLQSAKYYKPNETTASSLYVGEDPAQWDEPNFPLRGTLELVFDNLAGATLADASLTSNAAGTAPVSVFARIEGNSVKVTPYAPLPTAATTGSPYYLSFKLKKGAEDIWKLPNVTVDEQYGPVFIKNDTNGDRIVFTTVAAFGAYTTQTAGFATNIVSTNFRAYDDVVIEFNRPIKEVVKAELRYVRPTDVYYEAAASVSGAAAALTPANPAGSLSENGKVLTIKTSGLLAPSSTFEVRFKVESDDGQVLVYDRTDNGDPIAYVGGTNHASASIRLQTASTVIHVATNGKAIKGGIGLAVPTAPIPTNSTTVSLTFTPPNPSVDWAQTYTVWKSVQDVWATTTPTTSVPLGATTDQTVNASIPLLSGYSIHVAFEELKVKVRGIDNKGYVVDTPILAVPF
jgi:hypothetical protein